MSGCGKWGDDGLPYVKIIADVPSSVNWAIGLPSPPRPSPATLLVYDYYCGVASAKQRQWSRSPPLVPVPMRPQRTRSGPIPIPIPWQCH